MGRLLVLAATEMELRPVLGKLESPAPFTLPIGHGFEGRLNGTPTRVLVTGIGKTNAAAAAALAFAREAPRAAILMGIGGAFPGWNLEPGDVAVAVAEVHMDLGVRLPDDFLDLEKMGFPLLPGRSFPGNRLPLESSLAEQLAGNRARLVPFGAAESVTGDPDIARELSERWQVAVESMEGAAVAHVATAMGVPFAEARGISNEVGERDKGKWRLTEAVEAAGDLVIEWTSRIAVGADKS